MAKKKKSKKFDPSKQHTVWLTLEDFAAALGIELKKTKIKKDDKSK